MAWVADAGFTAVNLDVMTGNDAARRLYECAGFRLRETSGPTLALRVDLTGRPR